VIVLGLTGSIGMGKSNAAATLRSLGVPVFDADAEVHRLQGPGGALVAAIEALFPGTTGPDGVDRLVLGRAVLGDAVALGRLERLVHPAVGAARQRFLRRYRSRPVVVLDIPLLFETGGAKSCDAVVVVSAPAEIQRRRAFERPGMTAEKFAALLAKQMPDADKRARADFIVDSSQSFDHARAQVRDILQAIAKMRQGRK